MCVKIFPVLLFRNRNSGDSPLEFRFGTGFGIEIQARKFHKVTTCLKTETQKFYVCLGTGFEM